MDPEDAMASRALLSKPFRHTDAIALEAARQAHCLADTQGMARRVDASSEDENGCSERDD
jgi:hypothetical protein